MEILHTYGGEVTGPNVFLAVLYGVLAVIFLCALIYCVVRLESMGGGCALCCFNGCFRSDFDILRFYDDRPSTT